MERKLNVVGKIFHKNNYNKESILFNSECVHPYPSGYSKTQANCLPAKQTVFWAISSPKVSILTVAST